MKYKNKKRVTIQKNPKCIIQKFNSNKGISIIIKNQGKKKNNYKNTDKDSTPDRPGISIDPPTAEIHRLSVGIYKIKNNVARIKNDKKNKVASEHRHCKQDPPTAGDRLEKKTPQTAECKLKKQ